MCGCGCECVIVRVLHCAYELHCACCRRAKAKREAKERSAKKAAEAEAKAIKDEELRVREVEWGTEADWDLFSLKLPCGKDKTSKRRREVCAHAYMHAYMHTRTYDTCIHAHTHDTHDTHDTDIRHVSTRTRPLEHVHPLLSTRTQALFGKWDVNGNGSLSLAEVDDSMKLAMGRLKGKVSNQAARCEPDV